MESTGFCNRARYELAFYLELRKTDLTRICLGKTTWKKKGKEKDQKQVNKSFADFGKIL